MMTRLGRIFWRAFWKEFPRTFWRTVAELAGVAFTLAVFLGTLALLIWCFGW